MLVWIKRFNFNKKVPGLFLLNLCSSRAMAFIVSFFFFSESGRLWWQFEARKICSREFTVHNFRWNLKSSHQYVPLCCPLDWIISIHWNVVLAIFQHNNICKDCWKNIRSTFECMVILKSRGQGPKQMENKGTNLSHTFNKNLILVPWIGE